MGAYDHILISLSKQKWVGWGELQLLEVVTLCYHTLSIINISSPTSQRMDSASAPTRPHEASDLLPCCAAISAAKRRKWSVIQQFVLQYGCANFYNTQGLNS
jgi:hypothetical protein